MKKAKIFIALLRISLGWTFLYQGIVAYTNSSWSVESQIINAHTFTSFYDFVLKTPNITYVDLAIKTGMIAVGVLLVIGLFSRLASFFGILITLFFYFPLLSFPYVSPSFYIVDHHIVYALILGYLFFVRSGEYFGLGSLFRSSRY